MVVCSRGRVLPINGVFFVVDKATVVVSSPSEALELAKASVL